MKEKLKKKIKFVATLLKLRKINSNYDYRHTRYVQYFSR